MAGAEPGDEERKPRGGGRPGKAFWLAAALIVLAGTGTGVGLAVRSPDSGDGSGARASGTPGGSSPNGAAGRSAAEAAAPQTIPAVRSFRAAAGDPWRPTSRTRVVAPDDGPIADEARLLADELDVSRTDGAARAGDVVLKTDDGVPGGREGYRLTTGDGRVTISGSTDAGVFYGTRTLLQAVRSAGRLPAGTVEDSPDRPQRGLNLDIARKPYSADWIVERLHELADLKLNQLGLHFSDDQAFRIQSDSHPEIVSDPHLTKAEVRRIVRTARALHITVVPEIDSPGHLGAVIAEHPSIQLKDRDGKPTEGAVDVTDPEAAKIVDDLLKEFAPLFPGSVWHLGGDEYQALVKPDPEASYPDLAAAARKRYGSKGRIQDLATAWLNDRAKTVRGKGKKQLKAWNDGFFRGGEVTADKDLEVEYWTGKENGQRDPVEYLKEGRKVVNLNDEYLYYVLGQPNDFTYPTGERIYESWTPAVVRGTTPVPARYAGRDHILGARLGVWGDLPDAQTTEQVAQGIRLPLAALAQKLWDPRKPSMSWRDFKALAERVRG